MHAFEHLAVALDNRHAIGDPLQFLAQLYNSLILRFLPLLYDLESHVDANSGCGYGYRYASVLRRRPPRSRWE